MDDDAPSTAIAGLTFEEVVLGSSFACGLSAADSTAYCWGAGSSGQIGNGTSDFTVTAPAAVAMSVVSPKPVPVGVTTIEQFAIGFVNIAAPSAVGRLATNARYFGKFGISAVTSTTAGAITSFIGFIAQATLIVLTLLVGAGRIPRRS